MKPGGGTADLSLTITSPDTSLRLGPIDWFFVPDQVTTDSGAAEPPPFSRAPTEAPTADRIPAAAMQIPQHIGRDTLLLPSGKRVGGGIFGYSLPSGRPGMSLTRVPLIRSAEAPASSASGKARGAPALDVGASSLTQCAGMTECVSTFGADAGSFVAVTSINRMPASASVRITTSVKPKPAYEVQVKPDSTAMHPTWVHYRLLANGDYAYTWTEWHRSQVTVCVVATATGKTYQMRLSR